MVTATIPDLLRLLVVPLFGWAAVRDIKTRRVPNRTWIPMAGLGLALLAWDVWLVTAGETVLYTTLDALLLRTAISVGFVVPFAYVFWRLGGFGGADAKALMTLALVFPTYPHYLLDGTTLPIVESAIGVFSLTILSNTVLAGALYPGGMALRNAVLRDVSRLMFIGRCAATDSLSERYGRLLETTEGYTRGGVDLDILRMYLSWRGCSLSELREDPERFRDPDSLPAEPGDPGDGTVPVTDGGEPVNGDAVAGESEPEQFDDPWGAGAFFDDLGGPLYGTDPDTLREGLDVVTSRERVWYSPGIPFIVPMFGGLLVSLTVGDVLIWLLEYAGLA